MSSFRLAKSLARPVASNATLFICDVQERFRPLIHNMETVIAKTEYLNKVCNKLDIPCFITEQYPKALGVTVPDITKFPTTKVYPKMKFSMVNPEVKAEFLAERKQVILVGIESHVCVLQTAFDLLEEDIQVFLVCDAVSSQR